MTRLFSVRNVCIRRLLFTHLVFLSSSNHVNLYLERTDHVRSGVNVEKESQDIVL